VAKTKQQTAEIKYRKAAGPKTKTVIWAMTEKYTVSQKNVCDIFDCNLKTNYQILIIFSANIPDTTCHQRTV